MDVDLILLNIHDQYSDSGDNEGTAGLGMGKERSQETEVPCFEWDFWTLDCVETSTKCFFSLRVALTHSELLPLIVKMLLACVPSKMYILKALYYGFIFICNVAQC